MEKIVALDRVKGKRKRKIARFKTMEEQRADFQ